jgi:hypothetical protein
MLKNHIPVGLKKKLIRLRNKSKWKGSDRIFCVSMQRSGTTSVGDFFEHFGYPVSRWGDSWNHQWSKLWYNGDFESIFNSKEFKSFQVFEDDPWWFPDFYKILYHRFPNAKFVLFTRDSEAWFKSMLSHSEGQTLGNTKIHCKVYRREKEFYHKVKTDENFKPSEDKVDNLLPLIGHEKHYREIYEIRNKEIIEFFEKHGSNQLIHCDLTDSNKWKELGKFFGIDVPNDFKIHSNKS